MPKMIFDTHLHVWNAETYETPWRQGWGRFAPRSAFGAEDALGAMDVAGIERAALIPTEWDRRGSELVAETVLQFPDRFVGFGSLSLREELDVASVLRFCEASNLSGLRQIFLARNGHSFLDDESVDWLWASLEASSLPAMIWAPRQLDQLERVLARRPRLRLVIDHLNLELNPDTRELADEVEALCRLAAYAGVAVKASALTCALAGALDTDDLRRALARIVGAFGVERVFWGSDLTRTPDGYEGELEVLRKRLHLTDDQVASLLGASFASWLEPPRQLFP
jgi:L-fuconolactonase